MGHGRGAAESAAHSRTDRGRPSSAPGREPGLAGLQTRGRSRLRGEGRRTRRRCPRRDRPGRLPQVRRAWAPGQHRSGAAAAAPPPHPARPARCRALLRRGRRGVRAGTRRPAEKRRAGRLVGRRSEAGGLPRLVGPAAAGFRHGSDRADVAALTGVRGRHAHDPGGHAPPAPLLPHPAGRAAQLPSGAHLVRRCPGRPAAARGRGRPAAGPRRRFPERGVAGRDVRGDPGTNPAARGGGGADAGGRLPRTARQLSRSPSDGSTAISPSAISRTRISRPPPSSWRRPAVWTRAG